MNDAAKLFEGDIDVKTLVAKLAIYTPRELFCGFFIVA